MKRQSKTSNNVKITFLKKGGGSVRIKVDGKKRLIKPNQTFEATWEEIPTAFRDTIVPVSEDIEIPKEEGPEHPSKVDASDSVYEAKHVGGGWYDVFSSTGKKMNEKKMRSEEAEDLANNLNGGIEI